MGRKWWTLYLDAFSTVARTCFLALGLSGVILALSRIDRPAQLFTSG